MKRAWLLVAVVRRPGGAETYITPGVKANLKMFEAPDVQAGFAAKPSSPFLASVAAVRVQAPELQQLQPPAAGRQLWQRALLASVCA